MTTRRDGILTSEDLFEEVIGDIQDPASEALPERYIAPDGSMRASGTVRIEELGEEIGRPLEHEEVDTVSGLVLSLLDRPPQVGDRVCYEGVELEVLQVNGRGVGECRVRLRGPRTRSCRRRSRRSRPARRAVRPAHRRPAWRGGRRS